MEKIKLLLPFLLLLIVSIAVIVMFFPGTHQYGGISLPLDADAIIARSQVVLDDLKINYTGFQSEINLVSDRPLVRQMQERFGIRESNRLLRDSISGYFWDVNWRKKKDFFWFGRSTREAEEIVDALKGDIKIRFDKDGRVQEYQRKIGDSVHIPSLTSAEAKMLAYSFLKRYTTVADLIGDTSAIVSEKHVQQPGRNDHEFQWSGRLPVLGNKLDIHVAAAGNLVANYNINSNVPAEFAQFDTVAVMKYLQVILSILFGAAILTIAFKRIRSYEIGFRVALMMGVLTAIIYDIEIYFNMRWTSGWDIVIPLTIAPIFIGGFLVILWAISESLVHETWKEKFVSFDLITNGYLFHSRIGQNLIRGIAIGSASLALWVVIVALLNHWYPLWTSHIGSEPIHTFESVMPSLYVLIHSYYTEVFIFAFFALFAITFLHRYISSAPLVIGISAVAATIFSTGTLGPFVPATIIQLAVTALLFWTYYRYDAIASFIALLSYAALQEVGGLFIVDNPTYTTSAWIVVGLFALVLVFSFVSLFRKKEVVDFDEIAPAFAKHITERQRLQQELEIARSVQMSFLPKCNPSIPQFDICSRCAPALEVGGDYYDFIETEGKKLGVAVGDVSGKGTQAAFFMILTKGFLRALAHVSESPAKVLTHVNHLFYENVDRGMFISMIYSVFDMEKKTLTVACAGHNPVIIRKSRAANVQVVNPAGLALGLDPGPIFAQSIEEVTVEYQSGDLFVFYSDGITEAMNKNKEEYGEARLSKTVDKLAHSTAAEILEGIFDEMKSFVGKIEQHDDMTIVVVKVR
jgi:sigma-B regulation protein RsbU (phosphoserine phosphatase)